MNKNKILITGTIIVLIFFSWNFFDKYVKQKEYYLYYKSEVKKNTILENGGTILSSFKYNLKIAENKRIAVNVVLVSITDHKLETLKQDEDILEITKGEKYEPGPTGGIHTGF